MDAEQRLLEAVATTPAYSIVGVMAKLEMITGCSEADEDLSAFRWPQLRSFAGSRRARSRIVQCWKAVAINQTPGHVDKTTSRRPRAHDNGRRA